MLIVVSGPSGVGKTTITREVVEKLDALYSVSATTRPRTSGEVEGRDYVFLSHEEFDQRVTAGAFLEHAQVFGHSYGTPRAPVEASLEAGRTVVLEIDVQGGLQVRRSMPEAYMIFVLPPDEDVLEERLRSRGRDSDQEIARRLRDARREIDIARESEAYDLMVVNDELERCIHEVLDALRRERDRRRKIA